MQRLTGLVSVVIPAYNAAGLIRETIESILGQQYPCIEIIIVDDGSTDATASVVREFGCRVRLARQPNSGGCSSPRNHGLRLAQGEYVTFFDADDLMLPDKLTRQVEFLESHPDVSMVLMDYRNFDEAGPAGQSHFDTCRELRAALRVALRAGIVPSRLATSILIKENFGIAGSPLFRRSILDACAGFDEGLQASEDFDLIYRAAREANVGIIDKVGFFRRIHRQNMSNRSAHILRFKIASRAKLIQTERDPGHRRRLRGVVANYHLSMAEHIGRTEPGPALYHTWEAVRLGCNAPGRILKSIARSMLGAVTQAGIGRNVKASDG